MIKIEKEEGTINAELKGSTHTLVVEFQTALHMLYQMLDESIEKTGNITPRDFMHSMVDIAADKERRNKDED
ncbi:hypothetical protein [Blautia sp. 1033sp1_1033st1_G9_1033SCRN_220408]|uniref:hypothetical protein n=1 Tax=Blautia sp. 1033sp1_1033st1_G9_1033SCRN_220408 TaxID=3144490 RepID=UPI0034A24AC5